MKPFRRFFIRRQNLVGLGIVLLFFGLALAAPRLAPLPLEIYGENLGPLPVPPNSDALLGTIPVASGNIHDDVFKMLVWGANSALKFGLLVSLTTNLFGVLVGAASGYFGGWVNEVTMRVTDAFLTFPVIAGVALFQTIYFPSDKITLLPPIDLMTPPSPIETLLRNLNLDPLMMAFILFSWMAAARLTNSVVLQIKENEFFEAARALGASPMRIILRHILPNSIQPAVVLIARDIGLAVLLQAGFAFIGLVGGSPWGELLAVGRRWILGVRGDIFTYWWAFLPATLAIVLFGIGWNLLGDGLNDWLNPHQA
jgi:peptide/nickel transport system permease protein